jgi:hypothetical protein
MLVKLADVKIKCAVGLPEACYIKQVQYVNKVIEKNRLR